MNDTKQLEEIGKRIYSDFWEEQNPTPGPCVSLGRIARNACESIMPDKQRAVISAASNHINRRTSQTFNELKLAIGNYYA